jgi:hypothetical protein
VEIRINEQPMDITLDEEKTLGDVVEGISSWLGDSGFSISAIEYDGHVIIPDEAPHWQETDLGNIGTLNLTVLSPAEKYAQDLHTVHQFTRLLHKALAGGNTEILDQLKQEAPYVVDNIDELLGQKASGYGKQLAALLEAAGVNSGSLTTRVQDLLTYTKNLAALLEDRIREASSPFSELKRTVNALEDLNPKLMDVSVLLQTGKDREAMNRIIEFTEITDKLIRIYHILLKEELPQIASVEVEGVRFDRFYEELNENLRELVEAFDAQDSVLIGDLLEYEVAPRTERLKHYIDVIEQENMQHAEGD